MKKIVIILCSIAILSGCSKQVNDPLPAQNPSPTSQMINGTIFTSMPDVFKSINVAALQTAINNNDDPASTSILISLANKIYIYIQNNYDATFTANVSTNYKEIIVMGMAYLEYEANPVGGVSVQSSEVDCIITVVGSIIGVNDVMGIVNDFRNGVSATTLMGTARLALKRVATAITVAIAIYELGDCLDWW